MPRKQSDLDFIKNQLRFLISWKKTPPATRLRAIHTLAAMTKLLDIRITDDTGNGEHGDVLHDQATDVVQKMLHAALNVAKKGGDRGDNVS